MGVGTRYYVKKKFEPVCHIKKNEDTALARPRKSPVSPGISFFRKTWQVVQILKGYLRDQGAKYLVFVSSHSLKTREKYKN